MLTTYTAIFVNMFENTGFNDHLTKFIQGPVNIKDVITKTAISIFIFSSSSIFFIYSQSITSRPE